MKRILIALAAVAALLGSSAVLFGGAAASTTLSATANSRITRLTPTTHYCCLSTLRADVDDYDSLIRFDLSGVSGVTNASLRMFVGEGGQPVQVRDTIGSWAESTVTWNSAPPSGTLAGTFSTSGTGTW